jgi:membrane-associated phospholipid phosphatase
MITEGLKDVAGKPRPHLLALCDPDTSPESIRQHRVGGLGPDELTTSIPILVTWEICRTKDTDALHNAFASWPSGHSSFAWSGMLYLTLFLCAKFGVHIPILLPSTTPKYLSTFDEEPSSPSTFADPENRHEGSHHHGETHYRDPRNRAAAPPVYLLFITMIPIGAASYICVSRWFDYRHHGIDILTGSLIGCATAYFGFRLYHLPIRQGAGWSWGARSRNRAFWLGIGTPNYVGAEGWQSASYDLKTRRKRDMELGMRDGRDVEMRPFAQSRDAFPGAANVTGAGASGDSRPGGGMRHATAPSHMGPGYGRSISDNRLSTRSDEGYLLESKRSSEDDVQREPRDHTRI